MRPFWFVALASLIAGLFLAVPRAAVAIEDEPPPVFLPPTEFVVLAPGDLACTDPLFVASTARIAYVLLAQGTPVRNPAASGVNM